MNNSTQNNSIPSQEEIEQSVSGIPIQYFKWGTYPDNFIIDKPHRHEFSELLFFTKGGGIHEVNNIKYNILSNSIHYVPQSMIHYLARSKESDGFTIAFDSDYMENNSVHRFISPLGLTAFCINCNEFLFNSITRQINILRDQIKLNQNEINFKRSYLLSFQLILNTIAEIAKNKIKTESTTEQNTYRNFKYLVKLNVHRHRNVSWYADKLNVSAKHLGNIANNKSGNSAKNYINQVFIEKIKGELLHTNKPLKQIACEVDMDKSYLAKLFKKQVQCTMLEFRKGK